MDFKLWWSDRIRSYFLKTGFDHILTTGSCSDIISRSGSEDPGYNIQAFQNKDDHSLENLELNSFTALKK